MPTVQRDTLQPDFPVLITGSYNRTTRVWNLEMVIKLHCLKGHLQRPLILLPLPLLLCRMLHAVAKAN
ncbi:hypothetical protein DFH08DRAFT_969442 [Mycena albidolilacea]|uniref:Uncharacterized protein n=1 Tax=Mycena albidolilacea TaxID=1033008 RepID=A0AAD6ZHX3_9AGAR|nr:hypothetical protein DFH08DRAFT_969442 [Mycena albidolilacea]